MAKTLSSTIKALQRAFGGPTDIGELPQLEQIILLILCKGSDVRRARSAMKHLQSDYVDWNDVRVTGVYEIAAALKSLGGQKRVLEKAERVSHLLTVVYNRFNKLSLDFLLDPNLDVEVSRKRDRFLNYLQDMVREARKETAAIRKRKEKKALAAAKTEKSTAASPSASEKPAKKPVAPTPSVPEGKPGHSRVRS